MEVFSFFCQMARETDQEDAALPMKSVEEEKRLGVTDMH